MPKIKHSKTPVLNLIRHLEAEGFQVVMTQQLTSSGVGIVGWRLLFFNENLELQTLDASRQVGDLKALEV